MNLLGCLYGHSYVGPNDYQYNQATFTFMNFINIRSNEEELNGKRTNEKNVCYLFVTDNCRNRFYVYECFYGNGSRGSWLTSQSDGIADTSQYMMIIETYTNNFVIIGSVLLGLGLLIAICTYVAFLFDRVKEKSIRSTNLD